MFYGGGVGGNVPRRPGIPLKDRPVIPPPNRHISGGAAEQAVDMVLPAAGASAATGRRRHCWVSLPDHDGNLREVEGLVLDWTKEDGTGWVAWTLYVTDDPEARTVQEWLPAHRLRPA